MGADQGTNHEQNSKQTPIVMQSPQISEEIISHRS